MKNGKHVTLKRIASTAIAGGALSALFACGIAPASDSEVSASTAQASTACENTPGTQCTAQVVSKSLSEAGFLFVQCPGTVGNGVYDLFLATSLDGPWTQAKDTSNPTGAIPYTKADFKGDIAIVIGAEGDGISQVVRKECDFLVEIPMFGSLESLNASVAAGVLLFEARRQREQGTK